MMAAGVDESMGMSSIPGVRVFSLDSTSWAAMALALAAIAALARDRPLGDFRTEDGVKVHRRLLCFTAPGQIVFLDWREVEGRPLGRLRRFHHDEEGETFTILLFHDADAFADLDRRPSVVSDLEPGDLRTPPAARRVPVARRGDGLVSVVADGRRRGSEGAARIKLAFEPVASAEGFECGESARSEAGGLQRGCPCKDSSTSAPCLLPVRRAA